MKNIFNYKKIIFLIFSISCTFSQEKLPETFLKDLNGKKVNVNDIWNSRHQAYFKAWENYKYSGNMKYVVWHDSAGFYISNHNKYFEEFPKSFWVYPLREIYGYIASEKTRLARRFYGSRRFPKLKISPLCGIFCM